MNDPDSESRRTRSWLRFDLLIAVSALLISALTAGASVYQTRVIANQLSASVWPYLDFSITQSPSTFDFELVNDGLGPAIVKSVRLTLDGKPVTRLTDLLTPALRTTRSHPHAASGTATLAGVFAGTVIRPNTTQKIVTVLSGAALTQAIVKMIPRLSMHVCYCSLLDQCWSTESGSDTAVVAPQAVAHCPAPGPADLQPNRLN